MKTALITGSSKGIGYACAKRFIENGYYVIITARNEKKLKKAKSELGNKCEYLVWDCADTKSASKIIDKAHSIFGDICVFVNNAGIVHDEIYGDCLVGEHITGEFYICRNTIKD